MYISTGELCLWEFVEASVSDLFPAKALLPFFQSFHLLLPPPQFYFVFSLLLHYFLFHYHLSNLVLAIYNFFFD
jgi:hypothetical protein